MMSEENLAKLAKLCEDASPGPWMQANHVGEPKAIVSSKSVMDSLLAIDPDGMATFHRVEDAAFVVAARAALPELVAELRMRNATVKARR